MYYSAADPNQDFDSLDGDPAEAFAIWRAECDHARDIVARTPSVVQTGRCQPDGQPISLRRILVDMITEYARHDGHADLLRERVDGATGVLARRDSNPRPAAQKAHSSRRVTVPDVA